MSSDKLKFMDDILYFNTGARIRELRQQRRFSQEHLAFESGISITHLRLIETGKKNPTIKVIEKITHALGVSLHVFFNDALPDDDTTDELMLQLMEQLKGSSDIEKRQLAAILTQIQQYRNLPR